MADKQRGLLLRLQTKDNGNYPVWKTEITEFSSPTPTSTELAISLNINIKNTIMYDSKWDEQQFKKQCEKDTTNAVYLDEPADRDVIDKICEDKNYAFLRFKDDTALEKSFGINVGELKMKMKGKIKDINGIQKDPPKIFLEFRVGDGDKVNRSGG